MNNEYIFRLDLKVFIVLTVCFCFNVIAINQSNVVLF